MKNSLWLFFTLQLCIRTILFTDGEVLIGPKPLGEVPNINQRKSHERDTIVMTNHGGPVLTNPVLYVIWYGTWKGTQAYTIVKNFLNGFGSTKWWQINYAYGVKSGVKYSGSIFDNYSQGKSVSDTGIFNIFSNALKNGLPLTPKAIYLVLTSPDVVETTSVNAACGWHDYATDNKGNYYPYGWAGNPGTTNTGCIYQTTSPNGNTGADAIVSTIAHELAEVATDPEWNAWYDNNGNENGDDCAWNFGTTNTLSNGAEWNLQIGSSYYLIQELWNLNTNSCTMTP